MSDAFAPAHFCFSLDFKGGGGYYGREVLNMNQLHGFEHLNKRGGQKCRIRQNVRREKIILRISKMPIKELTEPILPMIKIKVIAVIS